MADLVAPDAEDTATADLLLVAALYRERYIEGVSRDLLTRLADAEIDARARLTARLERLSGPDRARIRSSRPASTKTHAALVDEIRALAKAYRALTAETIRQAGKDLVPVELEFQAEAAERQGATLGTVTVAAVIAAAAARPINGIAQAEALRMLERNVGEKVMRRMRDGVKIGREPDQIMADIMGRHVPSGDGSALGGHRRGADALARTQVATQADQAMIETAKAAKDVGQIAQLVTFDRRTSVLCRSISSLIQPADALDLRTAPHHLRCRTVSYWIPSPDATVGGTRASKGASGPGQISTSIGLAPWMRRQGRAFVSDSIGPTRAKLFLDGGLKLEQFSDLGALRPLTIDELRQRHRAAFERAGLIESRQAERRAA